MSDTHLLLHNLQLSQCTTPWTELLTCDKAYRTCPYCLAQIFNVNGLDESQVIALIRTAPRYQNARQNVWLRKDGTLTVGGRLCSKPKVTNSRVLPTWKFWET